MHRCTGWGWKLPGSQNEVGQIINVIRANNWGNNFKKKTYAMYLKIPCKHVKVT